MNAEAAPRPCNKPAKCDPFTRFSQAAAHASGTPYAFGIAIAVIVIWGVTGPVFDYSDTWQLIINTSTTIITFLMVFLIQNTQNRDTMALQLKLDELIRVTDGAHNVLMDLENLSEKELTEAHNHYLRLAEKAREHLRKGGEDTERMLESDDPEDAKPGTPQAEAEAARDKAAVAER